nr:vWA domain-containing protein [uncultured Blautia sp.]
MGMFDEIGQGGLDPVGGQGYCVDIAMLIDATGSMSPIINEVKENAMAFCTRFHEVMEVMGKNVDELRIKVIPFRDYAYDGAQAMEDSGFFSLPEQNDGFRNYVSSITATGGGDEPESALEAMALAMRSDWTTRGAKRRHVILVFTDASAVPLKESNRTKSDYYPENMPANLAELGDMWSGCTQELGGMPDEQSARLVLFAPNVKPWCDMQVWNNVWASFSKAGAGLSEVDIDMAIQLLVASVG